MSQPPPPPPGPPPGTPPPPPGDGARPPGDGAVPPAEPAAAPGSANFGPPQAPAAGADSYGYPQAPPPTPPPPSADPGQGYAAPGAPPPPGDGFGTPLGGAPSPPPDGAPGTPGYGYPQAGYGYPTAPQGGGVPPSFGAPTAPMGAAPGGGSPYGPHTGGGSGKGRWSFGGDRGPLLVLLVGVVVSALIAGGFGAWHVMFQDDAPSVGAAADDEDGADDGAPAEDDTVAPLPEELVEARLLLDEDQPAPDDGVEQAAGQWVQGDTLIRMMPDRLVAWDIPSQEEVWEYPMENRGDCSVSEDASEGRIAILEGRDCEQLTAFDLTAGEALWTEPLPDASSITPTSSDRPVILGDYIALGWFLGGHGWSVSDQELLWSPNRTDDCRVSEYGAMDGMFIERAQCGDEFLESNPGYLRGTTPEGDEIWRWDFEAEHEGTELWPQSVISTDPLVVMVGLGERTDLESVVEFWVLDAESGEVDNVLAFDEERHEQYCSSSEGLAGCTGYVVHEGELFLPSLGNDNSVVVFDLTTGNAIYEVSALGTRGGRIIPVAEVAGEILAYQPAGYDIQGMLVAIDPETEEGREVMVMPQETQEREYQIFGGSTLDPTALLWDDERFFLVRERFYENRAGESMMLVFG